MSIVQPRLWVRAICVSLGVVAYALCSQPGKAQGIFVSVTPSKTSGYLDVLNPLTGQLTQVGETKYGSSLVALNGLAMMPSGQLIGTDHLGNVYQVSESTGALTKLGSLGMTGSPSNVGLSSNGSGGLYALGLPTSGSDSLFKVNSSTGAATLVGSSGATGQALDGAIAGGSGNTLYATEGGGSYGTGFFSVNATTGATTLLANQNDGSMLGLGMYNGVMYGENATGGIYSINLTTGAATLVSNYSTTNGWINAAASANTPEPGAIATLICVAVSGARLRRRARRRATSAS